MDKKVDELFKKFEEVILKIKMSDDDRELIDNSFFSIKEMLCLYFSCFTTYMARLKRNGLLDENIEETFYDFAEHLVNNTIIIAKNSPLFDVSGIDDVDNLDVDIKKSC